MLNDSPWIYVCGSVCLYGSIDCVTTFSGYCQLHDWRLVTRNMVTIPMLHASNSFQYNNGKTGVYVQFCRRSLWHLTVRLLSFVAAGHTGSPSRVYHQTLRSSLSLHSRFVTPHSLFPDIVICNRWSAISSSLRYLLQHSLSCYRFSSPWIDQDDRNRIKTVLRYTMPSFQLWSAFTSILEIRQLESLTSRDRTDSVALVCFLLSPDMGDVLSRKGFLNISCFGTALLLSDS